MFACRNGFHLFKYTPFTEIKNQNRERERDREENRRNNNFLRSRKEKKKSTFRIMKHKTSNNEKKHQNHVKINRNISSEQALQRGQ